MKTFRGANKTKELVTSKTKDDLGEIFKQTGDF